MPQRPTQTRPTHSRPFVRLVLAISLDGRLAPPVGGAAQLGGEGDRRALERALAWGDACLIRSPQLLEQRRSEGRTEQPAAVVVSRSPDFSSAWRFFNQPLQRWLLAPEPVDQGFDRWFPLAPTWPERLQALGAAGIQRLVLLGGAQLSADLLQADCVDALQLTLVPQLLGGRFSWLPCTNAPLPAALAQPGAWQSEGAEDLGDGEWLVRYRRIRSG